MDSAELRALQQPLKDAYREDPEKAVVTLRARGQPVSYTHLTLPTTPYV